MIFYPDNDRPERQSHVTRRRNDEHRLAAARRFGAAFALFEIFGDARLPDALKREIDFELRRPVPARKYTTRREEREFRAAYRHYAKELVPLEYKTQVAGWGEAEVAGFWARLDLWAEMKPGVSRPRVVAGRPYYLGESDPISIQLHAYMGLWA